MKAAGPSDPRREAEQDCLMEPLLDWMAEAISEGAMELIREMTLEATLEWTASSRFSACNLIASVRVDGMSLARRAKLKLYWIRSFHLDCEYLDSVEYIL